MKTNNIPTNALLAHSQLPTTSSDWAHFSHSLHHILKNEYAVDLKAGKLLHAMAKSAQFTNSHDMTDKLDEFHAQISKALKEHNEIIDIQNSKADGFKKIAKFMKSADLYIGNSSLELYKEKVCEILFLSNIDNLSVPVIKGVVNNILSLNDTDLKELVFELSQGVKKPLSDEMIAFFEEVYPEYSESATAKSVNAQYLENKDYSEAYKLAITHIFAEKITHNAIVKIKQLFGSSEAKAMLNGAIAEKHAKEGLLTCIESGATQFIVETSNRTRAKMKEMEQGA